MVVVYNAPAAVAAFMVVVDTLCHPQLLTSLLSVFLAPLQLRSYTGGPLPWFDGGYKDEEHFHGNPFGQYNLWVARDDLFPQYYKPSDIKVLKEVLASSNRA